MRALPVLLAACVLVSACTRVGSGSDGRRPGTVPHVLRIAEFSEPDTLNPYLSELDVNYAIASLVYSYLIVSDDRGRLVGDLATDVPSLTNGGISRDGRTVVYHLRHGVRWQDGVPFTARDVVASWHAVMDPTHQTLYRNGYDRVSSISTPDDFTVVIHLATRYPPFVSQFFAPLQEGAKPILAAHVLARTVNFNRGRLATGAIGTGPFKFAQWKHGESMTLVRNDAYFRGPPKLERIEYRFYSSAQTMATVLGTNHADVIETPPLSLYPVLRGFPGLALTLSSWNSQGFVLFNHRVPGVNDLNVRRAIALALDRPRIVETTTRGVGEVAYDVLSPGQLGYEKRALDYDPAQANVILDHAGWLRGPDGVRVKDGTRLDFAIVTIAESPTYVQVSEEIQQSLRAIGIRISVKPVAVSALFTPSGPIRTEKFEIAMYGSELSWDPDSHIYYACNEAYPKGQNVYGFCDPRYDRLQEAALDTDDPAVRARLYRESDGVLWDDVAYIPLYQMRRIVATNPDLRNYRPNGTSAPWWNAWQWDI